MEDADKEYRIRISDVSSFRNYPEWLAYRQKTRLMAVIIWVLIIYIFFIWIKKSVIHVEKYKQSSHYLLLLDAALVIAYVWLVMPYHTPTQNKFSGIREMQRQMARQQIDELIDDIGQEQAQCGCGTDYTKLINELKQQIEQKDIEIDRLTKSNGILSSQVIASRPV